MKEGERIKKRLKALECILHIFFDMAHPCWLPSCSDLSFVCYFQIPNIILHTDQTPTLLIYKFFFMIYDVRFDFRGARGSYD